MTVPQETSVNLYPSYKSFDVSTINDLNSSHLINFGGTFFPYLIVGAKGCYVYTHDGRKIFDFTSGQMSCLLGHGNEEIVKVVSEHMANLDHTLSAFVSPPVLQLADSLTSMLPDGLDRAMFLSTGGEANEAAIKLAKVATGKYEVVGLSLSWHGMTSASGATTYSAGRALAGPVLPGNFCLPAPNPYRSVFRKPNGDHDWEAEMEFGWGLIDHQSTGSLCCVIIEPILSSGGILPLPDGYLAKLKEECRKRDMLLIVDEAQTGIGRCGKFICCEYDNVVPDILSLSKTLGNGLPLSAIVTSNELADKAQANGYLFYTTHVNDPLPCAVGAKVLEIVKRDGLVEKVQVKSKIFFDGLNLLKKSYPKHVGDIRGKGLMAGVEIVKSAETKEPDPALGNKIGREMMKRGLSANLVALKQFGSIFRIAPPITVTEEELTKALGVMKEAFDAVLGSTDA